MAVTSLALVLASDIPDLDLKKLVTQKSCRYEIKKKERKTITNK